MSLISMTEARLPAGFRFHPRDEELVMDYLRHKLSGACDGGGGGGVAMVDVDLNKCEPWNLPDEACVGGREWYFFSLHDRKYATGQRTNRATQSGYWKATGKDRAIASRRVLVPGAGGAAAVVVGMRKTLVFYQGRAPRGSKTEWVMHEFRVEGHAVLAAAAAAAVADHPTSGLPPPKEDWVLCRVFYKSRTATPSQRPPASDEAASLSGDLSVPPSSLLLPMAPAAAAASFVRGPTAAAVDGYYHEHGQQCPAGGLPAALPFASFRDLLSSMVEGGGGGGGGEEAAFGQDWSDQDGCVPLQCSGAMPQPWNSF